MSLYDILYRTTYRDSILLATLKTNSSNNNNNIENSKDVNPAAADVAQRTSTTSSEV